MSTSKTAEETKMQGTLSYSDSHQNKCGPGGGCSPQSITGYPGSADSNFGREILGQLDFLWLELTPKCNLRCVHCYAESDPYQPLTLGLLYKDWYRALKEAADLGCKKVQFIGGEPTLYPHLKQLIADARENGYQFIEVFTNGTVLSDSLLHTFKAFQVNLAFSIYSSEAETHDRVTRKRGSFMSTLTNVQRALDCGVKVRASIIETGLGSSEFESIVSTLNQMGVESISRDGVRAVGRGAAHTLARTDPPRLCGACWQGKLCIDSSGLVFPCVFARDQCVGKVRDGLRNILDGPSLQGFRSALYEGA